MLGHSPDSPEETTGPGAFGLTQGPGEEWLGEGMSPGLCEGDSGMGHFGVTMCGRVEW